MIDRTACMSTQRGPTSIRARAGKYSSLWIIILPCHPFVFEASCFHNDLIERYCLLLNCGRHNWGPLRPTNQLAKIFHKNIVYCKRFLFYVGHFYCVSPANHLRGLKFAYLTSSQVLSRLIFNFHFSGANDESIWISILSLIKTMI